MPLNQISVSGAEPIDAAMCRAQLRWTSTAEDTLFTNRLIPAARSRAEGATRRQLRETALFDLILDAFPCEEVIELPKPPLTGVTYIKYVDTAGTLQTWSASEYLVQTPAGPKCRRGRITPAYGYTWPTTRPQMGAVTIRFGCGYAAAAVDPLLLQAMLLDVGGLWEFRENLMAQGTQPVAIPTGAADIYRAFRSLPLYPLPAGID